MENAPADPHFDFPALVQALAALGPGDLSVNEAAARQPGSTMLANAGSPNDQLWAAMEAAGGARFVTLDSPVPDTRAFQFTEGGAAAIAAAFRVLLARKTGTAPAPDKDARFTEPLIAMRSRLLAERQQSTDAMAHLEAVQPKTAEREAKKAELLSAVQIYALALDTAIGDINDAIATGVNKFGIRYVERATRILDASDLMVRAINEKLAS